MRNRLYCTYDIVAEEIFGGIMRAQNDEVARRAFHQALAAKDSPLAGNPHDYQLLVIAEMDTQTLTVTPHDPNVLASGKDWVDANKER